MNKYIVFEIKNKITNFLFVGVNKLIDVENIPNEEDFYIGACKKLQDDIVKYGIENFTKEVTYKFNTPQEMFAKEEEIVNNPFIESKITYNTMTYGYMGVEEERYYNPDITIIP